MMNVATPAPVITGTETNPETPDVAQPVPLGGLAAPITPATPAAPAGRSYTKRVEIDGKIIFATLHPDRIELSARYGRQTAEWSFEKLWQAAEGKLL